MLLLNTDDKSNPGIDLNKAAKCFELQKMNLIY